MFDGQQPIKVTYSDGSKASLGAQIHGKVCNYNNVMHMLSCQTALSSLTNSIKEIILSTGISYNGRQTDTINTTAAMINGTDLLLGMVHVFVQGNVLYVKVVFSETPSYTSIKIRSILFLIK